MSFDWLGWSRALRYTPISLVLVSVFGRERSRDRDKDKKRDQEDEDDVYERRRMERKLREKEAAYQEVRRGWP